MNKDMLNQTAERCRVDGTDPAWLLSDVDPRDKLDLTSRKKAGAELADIHTRLRELQMNLHAEGQRSLLVVLQAMDAGGKDGTIRNVFGPLNPHWCRVTDFKAPTTEEAGHDFLWRIHHAAPRRGVIGIFNRSHYEDVLIARVRKLAPPEELEVRYDQINDFERMLTVAGTTIIKIHLVISQKEQRERFESRLTDPRKQWKFSINDVGERKLWDQYQQAYQLALHNCSPAEAPWYAVPADRKWARNVIVARLVLKALEEMAPRIPKVTLPEKKIDF